MTDHLQTGLATGSKTISHTRFDSVYIRPLYEQLSLKLDFALQSQLLVLLLFIARPSQLFHLPFEVLKGGSHLRSLVIVL